MLHVVDMDDFDSIDRQAGSKLQAWRENKGLTQEQLAEMVGTQAGQISLLEHGHRQLSVKWLNRLAPALGITPGWLLDNYPGEIPLDIREMWGKIPKAQQQVAREVLRAFTPFPLTGTD